MVMEVNSHWYPFSHVDSGITLSGLTVVLKVFEKLEKAIYWNVWFISIFSHV